MIFNRKVTSYRSIKKIASVFCCFAFAHPTFASTLPSEIFKPDQSEHIVSGGIAKNESVALDQITKNILQKEFELQRLNTAFRMETTLVRPWRQRRVFAYGEASACSAEASAIIAMPVLYRLSNRNTHLTQTRIERDRTQLTAAVRVSLVGQSIAAGGDIFELGLNFINYQSLKKKGFSPKLYRNRVNTLRVELDQLIEQRSALITNVNALSASDVRAAQAESRLLENIRDLSLLEYSRYHSDTRRFWTYQNTAFLVDLTKNSTGIASNLVALAANHLRRPRLIGGAGVLSIVNGGLILVTPVVGRVTGNLSGLAASRTTSKELINVQADNVRNYSANKSNFINMITSPNESTPYLESARLREPIYEQHEKSILSMRQFLQKQRERAKGTLRENIVFASVVGPPRVAGGITSVLGGWDYSGDRITVSRLYAAGATGNACGAGFAIFETARVEASFELQYRERAKNNLLPKQQFSERLRVIDQMQKELSK